ncbi:MAG TPA: IclR family transcriptional regulator C-terminal domain-containing protein [Alphaproteobacteria bacterium]|nr:IclR family transcriptional regulator C-terminal domain-containing protein [Alphaproteobacteria bacterium]
MASIKQKAAPESGSAQVQSLVRGLALLERLAAADDGATLTELAQAAGLAPSTTHRLLRTLEQERFAHQDPESGRWSVGVAAFTVGSAFARARTFAAVARPFMRRLVEVGGETVNLAVEDAGEAVYLAQVESQHMMRAFARVGARVPLHGSGVGKALLAGLPPGEAETLARRLGLARLTERTLTDSVALLRDLAETRRRGYAVDDEEHAVGLRCVASTIHDEAGRPLAALSVSGPAARITDARLDALGRLVAETCRDITGELGGRLPG